MAEFTAVTQRFTCISVALSGLSVFAITLVVFHILARMSLLPSLLDQFPVNLFSFNFGS
jgi:hypothetical protein